MRCTNCESENPAGARFCEQCGQRLAQICPQCGHESGPAAKFCGGCGALLASAVAVPRPGATPRLPVPAPIIYTPPHLAERIRAECAAMEAKGAGAAGERKTITALFADMAGSTALIQDLDPEEARSLIDPVVALMMEAVHHYEGYVAKSLGDGILALFGAPIAHEDHALRALFAALHMQQAMRRHGDRTRQELGVQLEIRVGVHTGEVVVRSIRQDDLRTDYDPVGQTIHIAARMEGLAAPSSILVSESTHRLTEGYFEFKALGRTEVKGLRMPLAVYEVLGPGALRTRLQVGAHRGLARFVGRKAELARLGAALELASAGQGQIVGVVGEAGVGKSRLFHEFKARAQQGCLVLETFSVSHGKAFPYLPLIDLLRNYFQITAQDDERRFREKATARLLTLDRSLEEHLPYLLYLLGIIEPGSALPSMDPAIRRQRTFEAIARLLVRESRNEMLMVLFEDLQWLDSETEAFLDVLISEVPAARIFLLVNYRPEYRHEWGSTPCYTQLNLEPFGHAEAQGLLTVLLGDDPSLAPLRQLILAKTEGNPFFMEEVIQTLAEEHTLLGLPGNYRTDGAPLALHIPTTVQGVLAARIDRLPVPQKELLQTLAVIGTEFPSSLVRHVTGQPQASLQPLLADLQSGNFIYERPAYPEAEYAFRHALTQEVAGNSLLSGQRSILHERAARAIETLFPGRLKEYCSELAHHYSQSGNVLKAVRYLHCAGRQEVERSAHRDAIRHLNMALELLDRMPESLERARKELLLRVTLGHALIAAQGYASSEVEANFTRALAVSEQGGELAYFQVSLGLRNYFSLRAQHENAYEAGERLLKLATKKQGNVLLAEACTALGSSSFFMGEFERARTQLHQGLQSYRSERRATHAALFGQDVGVRALAFSAWASWYLGFINEASVRASETVALGQSLSHPFSLALSLIFAAKFYQLQRDIQHAQECAEAAIGLSVEQGFPFCLAFGEILRGWALVEQGSGEEGMGQLRQGLRDFEATGTHLGWPYFMALLAEASAKTGEISAAINAIERALGVVNGTGERYHEAELHRLKGELILQRSSGDRFPLSEAKTAQACFQQALGVSRRQKARSLEIRAILSLARLYQREGKPGMASQILTEADWISADPSLGVTMEQARNALDWPR
ncbi:adenylate/guanylate cyclase domain-containing protein [Cupriavidus oxalaticus]|uniref:adenylate/guanylate cyclase domain-containing protein n=1 Tax=Cupriavidus oxalaticus TaxID=96344 RepID=UPI0031753759